MESELTLAKITDEQLDAIVSLEREEGIRDFVVPDAIEIHRKNLRNEKIEYLGVFIDVELIGFVILVNNRIESGVEIRRIAMKYRNKGLGQRVLNIIIEKCQHLHVSRIILDVFEGNDIATHVYEKMGFIVYKRSTLLGRELVHYEKNL